MKTMFRIIILVICLSLTLCYTVSFAETIEKVFENNVIEPIPGKSPEQLIASEQAKETIITLKQDYEKAPTIPHIPLPPEDGKPLLSDILIDLEQNGDLFIPVEQNQKSIDPSLRINEPSRNIYQRPRITFFDRSFLPSLEPPNMRYEDIRYNIYGPSYLTYLTIKWSTPSDTNTDTDDTLLYPSFGATFKMVSTLTTQPSTE